MPPVAVFAVVTVLRSLAVVVLVNCNLSGVRSGIANTA